MSSTATAAARLFIATRALLAPAKSLTSSATAAKAKPKPKAKSTATAKPKASSADNRPSGIRKVLPLSPELRSFLGVPEASRTDAVKQIWSYVKLHNLQNPANKREIRCDAKLKSIFDGKEMVGFLEIGRLMSRHFVKAA